MDTTKQNTIKMTAELQPQKLGNQLNKDNVSMPELTILNKSGNQRKRFCPSSNCKK